MIYVTKHITANDKDRKARLQQLQQKNYNSTLEKLQQLKDIAEWLQVNKQAEKVIFERNPIGSKINSFMNYLSSDDSDSPKDESPYYRDFYGRKRKRSTTKRDFYGRKITKGA